MDFREVTEIVLGGLIEFREVSFPSASAELVVSGRNGGTRTISFREIELLKWKGARGNAAPSAIDTVGLEKLGAGEAWRFYAQTKDGAELELSCRSIFCDGAEIGGVGRSYRH